MKYDFLIVGAGLYGAVFAQQAKLAGKKCLVIDKRDHIAGNIYTESVNDINIHKYGAHIFHTSNENVWQYINQFATFNNYVNSPLALYKDKLYNLPFNMNTFYQLWGSITPQQAKEKIEEQRAKYSDITPSNLEEQALSLAGEDIYQKLIKGYTEKQWGCKATEIPAFVIKRLPFRFTFNNNYFNDRYQGIPEGGYTQMVEKMLEGTEVELNVDFLENKTHYQSIAKQIIYTGEIDRFYDYCFGELQYRSLKFEHQTLIDTENFQGNAVVNYTEKDVPYTRIIEHKHFEFGEQKDTIITKEYPADWEIGDEPYYPMNNQQNDALYQKYIEKSKQDPQIIFGGRLGEYKYYDMDKVIESALKKASEIL